MGILLRRLPDGFERRSRLLPVLKIVACAMSLVYVCVAGAQSIPELPVAPLPASPLPSAGVGEVMPLPSVIVVPMDSTIGDSVRVILERDLDFGDLVRVIVLDSVSRATFAGISEDSLYEEAAQFNTTYVLRLGRTDNGVRATVFDVPGRRVHHASNIHLGWDSLGAVPRMDIHRVSDLVAEWMTGTRGISATRVAYVLDHQIHVIDSDGMQDTAVTATGAALSPAWHPRGTALVYSDLSDAGTQVVRVDLETGHSQTFTATRRGFNITPAFTPRGDSVVYASASVRGSRLVISSATGKGKARPLALQYATQMRDMAAPIFSPDGKRIAFVASRPLYPQIYTMDVNGKNVKRLVPASPTLRNERTGPDWSPDGSAIIYQQQNRKFQIWVAHLHGGVADTATRVTSQGENEDPSWAPDGRHVVLTSNRGGDKQLWILDLVSGRWRQLTAATGARLSSWSPRLQRQTVPNTR